MFKELVIRGVLPPKEMASGKLKKEMFGAGIAKEIEELMSAPMDFVRTKSGKSWGTFHYYNVKDTSAHSCKELTPRQIMGREDVHMAVSKSLKGDAQKLVVNTNTRGLTEALFLLQNRFGKTSTANQLDLHAQLWTTPWKPSA